MQSQHDMDQDHNATDIPEATHISCRAAAATADQADLAQLLAMGFDRCRALEALQEANHNIEAATNWLLTNVV